MTSPTLSTQAGVSLPELPPLPKARNVTCGVDLFIGLDIHEYAKAYATAALAAERAEAVRMREENEKLRKALLPFSRYFCSPPGECLCNNCVARDLLALSPSQGAKND